MIKEMKQSLVPDLPDTEVHFSVFAVRVQTKPRSCERKSPFSLCLLPSKDIQVRNRCARGENRRLAAVLDSFAAIGADRGREFDISANYRLL